MAVLAEDDETVVSVDAQLDNARFLLHSLKAIHINEEVQVTMNSTGLQFVVEDAKSIQASAFIHKNLFRNYSIREATHEDEHDVTTVAAEDEGDGQSGEAEARAENPSQSQRLSQGDLTVSLRLDMSTLIDCLALQLGGANTAGAAAGGATALLSAMAAGGGGGGAGISLAAGSSSGAVLCLQHKSQGPLQLWIEEGGVVTDVRARGRRAPEQMDFNFASEEAGVVGKVHKYSAYVLLLCIVN
jgi:hypothetical protein